MAAPRMDKLPGKDDIRYKPAPKPQLLQPDGPFVHIEAGVPPGVPSEGASRGVPSDALSAEI